MRHASEPVGFPRSFYYFPFTFLFLRVMTNTWQRGTDRLMRVPAFVNWLSSSIAGGFT